MLVEREIAGKMAFDKPERFSDGVHIGSHVCMKPSIARRDPAHLIALAVLRLGVIDCRHGSCSVSSALSLPRCRL
jgi:hypothetical protein